MKAGTGGPGAGWERNLFSADDVDLGLSENWLSENGHLNLRKNHYMHIFKCHRLGPSSIFGLWPGFCQLVFHPAQVQVQLPWAKVVLVQDRPRMEP